MALSEIPLPSFLDTSSADVIADFFVPALAQSVRYDRGVGYFSSGWLRIAAAGLVPFATAGGRARWVTSPILAEDDWLALQKGTAARDDAVLRAALARGVAHLAETLETKTLSALAWMVADGILTFKLALPRNKLEHGDFHDKFGVFTDAAGDRVTFNGSYNDSIQGTRNYESIKVFCSWDAAFERFGRPDVERFERLWNNEDPNVRVFDLPEAAREQILRLRTGDRPYPKPAWLSSGTSQETPFAYQPARPVVPASVALRAYQTEAIAAWFAHGNRGLLEMATGTGKTITALAASAQLYEREKRLAVVIVAPYQHLVDQWSREAAPFGYRPILAYQSKTSWLPSWNEQMREFTSGYRDFISVITTHTTFSSPAFQTCLARLSGPSLLIADEAHHMGAEHTRASYPEQVPFRLALSATPDRWFDDAGTAALRAFFGKTVFAFPLERAIGVSLTPYYYHPHLVALTDEEQERYEALSAKIGPLMMRQDEKGQEQPKMLLIRRAELLNNASNKLAVLSDLVDAQEGQLSHTLFYCAPGQIDDVQRLLGWDKGLTIGRFTAEESTKERQQLLTDFDAGRLQGLVAMKCLDEGVDVPSTRTAFLLASNSYPREFTLRRN